MPSNKSSQNISQKGILVEYYKNHPNKNIAHPEIVDWVVREYRERTGKIFRDPDRGIRHLHQNGFLIKIRKGVYRYDPARIKNKNLQDFTQSLKQQILKRDDYKCVMCGRGKREGVDLHVDHILPKDMGGKATSENGQTLCSRCNFLKKNLRQTESGKRMFIRLYSLAKKKGNEELVAFTKDLLKIYEKHGINGHIEWKE